jgi:hypothetical protein
MLITCVLAERLTLGLLLAGTVVAAWRLARCASQLVEPVEAAVDRKERPGEVGGIGGAQERDRGRELAVVADPTEVHPLVEYRLAFWPCGASVVLRGGVYFWPFASMVKEAPSSSARSIGVMRTILPSFTCTNTGPPLVMLQ